MKIRLVPKKKKTPALKKGTFFKSCRFSGEDVLVDYDTGTESPVKVCLFDALGHFIDDAKDPRGTLRIPGARAEKDAGAYPLFVRLADGEEFMEEFCIS